MRISRFEAVIMVCIVCGGIVVGCIGQEPSEKPILPAPTAKERSVPRPGAKPVEIQKNTNRIVGGVPSAGRPFIAALLYEKDGRLFQYCGASVIGDRWLLTAAHCEVKEGEWAIVNRSDLQTSGGVKLRVEHVYPHQQYNSTTHDNDIALLRLSGDLSSTIPHISVTAPPAAGGRVLAAGWGLTSENGKQSLLLREVEVPIVASTQCKTKYDDLTENMICAGESGKDSCQGGQKLSNPPGFDRIQDICRLFP
jgi:secreted trypsin-like serine protease